MGLSAKNHEHLLANLNPVADEPEPNDKTKCQHGCTTTPCRHTITSTDPFLGRDRELRGIPLVGAGGGAIAGTRPGDSAAELERAGRDIVRASLDRNKYRPEENL